MTHGAQRTASPGRETNPVACIALAIKFNPKFKAPVRATRCRADPRVRGHRIKAAASASQDLPARFRPTLAAAAIGVLLFR